MNLRLYIFGADSETIPLPILQTTTSVTKLALPLQITLNNKDELAGEIRVDHITGILRVKKVKKTIRRRGSKKGILRNKDKKTIRLKKK